MRLPLLLLGLMAATPRLPALPPGLEPTPENRVALGRLIRPKPAELQWSAIPWRKDLESAVAEARQQNKPIALWLMTGHPLAAV